MPLRTSRRRPFALSLVAVVAALAAGCGSRGGLDFDVVGAPAAGGGGVDGGGGGGSGGAPGTGTIDGSGGTGGPGGNGGTGADGGVSRDGSVPVPRDAGRDSGRDAEAGLVSCGTCVAMSCGQDLAACLADTACRTTLQCVATTCLGGGGTPDPTCFFTCAAGDTSALTKLVGIFTCITSKCGADCGNVLGGLGGGFPARGAAEGSGAEGEPASIAASTSRARARQLFSEYLPSLPALCSVE